MVNRQYIKHYNHGRGGYNAQIPFDFIIAAHLWEFTYYEQVVYVEIDAEHHHKYCYNIVYIRAVIVADRCIFNTESARACRTEGMYYTVEQGHTADK